MSVRDYLELTGGRPLVGSVRVPGDKSISHRALMLAALAVGESVLRGLSPGEDVRRSAAAMEALGSEIRAGGTAQPAPTARTGGALEAVGAARTSGALEAAREGEGAAAIPDESFAGELRVMGGPGCLHAPGEPLYAGNSGTTMRLVAGIVASLPWEVELGGDQSLSARPMDRIAVPLGAMGARVEGRGQRCLPPIIVRGPAPGASLRGIDYSPPMPSAQVKSAVLLAGLGAAGETVVRERVRTRVHTEELLRLAGADISASQEGGEWVVRVRRSALSPFELSVPGDPSQAAFWAVAGSIVPGSELVVESFYAGPERNGFLGVLERMGADLEVVLAGQEAGNGGGEGDTGSGVTLRVRASHLVGTEVHASEIPGLDEVPALAVAAALAEGRTAFREVGELRVKESDRLACSARLATLLGAEAEVLGDDLVIEGIGAKGAATTPRAFRIDALGDHRVAMAAAVGALAVPGGTCTIGGWSAVATSYPGFGAELGRLSES